MGKSTPGPIYVACHREWVATDEIGVDPEDALNRKWANEYADKKCAETLDAANKYTDDKVDGLRRDMEDADRGITDAFQAADEKLREEIKAGDKDTIDAAKEYADGLNDNTSEDLTNLIEEKIREVIELNGNTSENLTNLIEEKIREVIEEMLTYVDSSTQNNLFPVPIGTILIWPGVIVPMNYMSCNGAILRKDEYPELYKAIGDQYNTGKYLSFEDEITYSAPGADSFRLPNLEGRFIVGYSTANGYTSLGITGGENKHRLIPDEMPIHNHETKDYYYAETYKTGITVASGMDNIGKKVYGSAKSDGDNDYLHYFKHSTESKGGGQVHENRPPFYVMNYIIRVK